MKQRARARELRAAGMSLQEIADELVTSKQMVLDHTRDLDAMACLRACETLQERWASIDQAATILGISEITLKYRCEQGEIPGACMLGRDTWLIPREKLPMS